jgi:hypothetical protein
LLGSLTCALQIASAQSVLFTTTGDFTGWSGGANFTASPTNTPDLDGNLVDGLGNTGTAGSGGSLQLIWVSGTYNYIFSQGEQSNPGFLSAMMANNSIQLTYNKPPPGSGNYFQLGLVLNYDGHFDQVFGSETDNGNGTFTATIGYNPSAISAQASGAGITYFQLGVIFNSNFNTTTPFNIDNIQAVPEPGTMALVGLGAAGLFIVRRRRK